MNRRKFLHSASTLSAALAFPNAARLFASTSTPGTWRTFEVTTTVQVFNPSGVTRIWLPAALIKPTPFQQTLSNEFKAEGGTAKLTENKDDSVGIVSAEFPAGVTPVLSTTSRVTTKNYAVDLSTPGKPPKADKKQLEHFLRPTKLIPTDGIVKTTATEITQNAKTDLEKAQALSMNGWSKTPFEIQKRAAVAWATFASCSNPKIWREMCRPQCSLRWLGPRAQASRPRCFRPSSHQVRLGYKSLGPATERHQSPALPRRGLLSSTAGCPWTPPTCVK